MLSIAFFSESAGANEAAKSEDGKMVALIANAMVDFASFIMFSYKASVGGDVNLNQTIAKPFLRQYNLDQVLRVCVASQLNHWSNNSAPLGSRQHNTSKVVKNTKEIRSKA